MSTNIRKTVKFEKLFYIGLWVFLYLYIYEEIKNPAKALINDSRYDRIQPTLNLVVIQGIPRAFIDVLCLQKFSDI